MRHRDETRLHLLRSSGDPMPLSSVKRKPTRARRVGERWARPNQVAWCGQNGRITSASGGEERGNGSAAIRRPKTTRRIALQLPR